MSMKKIILSTLVAVLLCVLNLHAGKRWWISTTTSNWNNTANWSSISATGAGGASVPGSSDTAYFTSSKTGQCNLDANASVKRWEMAASCGTFTQSTYSLTVGTSGATLSGGTFTGGSGTITFTGAITISGTAFTSTSGTFTTNSNFTLSSGSFSHHSGTVTFTASNTIAGTITFYHLKFSPTSQSSYSVSNTITADGILTIEGSSKVTLDNGTINADSNVVVTNSSTSTTAGGTATIVFTSSFNQSFTGSGTAGAGKLPNITINKGGGTLSLLSVISVNGNWIYTAGTISPGTSTVSFYGNFNLDGTGSATMSFNRIQISGGTRTITGNVDANENFIISSGATCSAGSYTINVGGDWNSAGTWTYGTSTVVFDGNGYNKIEGAAGTINFATVQLSRNGSKNIRLLNPVLINTAMTFNKGRVYSTTTNYLSFADNATCSVTNNDSAYVHGPVRKTGNDAFTFPVGDTTVHDSIAYHPLAITAPSATGDQFQVQYFPAAQAYGSTKASTLQSVSSCEYWTCNRLAGTSTPTVSLSWNANCDNGSYSEMRVALWNGTQWNDLGQGSLTMSNSKTGTIGATTASSYTVNPAPITIAYTAVTKSYAPVSQAGDGGYVNTDGNILYFQYEEEYKDANGLVNFQIINVSNNTPVTLYGFPSAVNVPVKYGTNLFKMDLYTAVNTPLSSGMYKLVVTNDKNETWQLMFNKN